eukprot:403362850
MNNKLSQHDSQNVQQQYLHNSSEFLMEKELVKSQQAVIAKGFNPLSKKQIILKRYELSSQKDAFLKELKLLSKLNKSNISKANKSIPEIISYKSDKVFAEIIMSDAGTDLTQLLCSDASQQNTNKFQIATQVGFQVLSALEKIHECGYTHQDIKLDNVCAMNIEDQNNIYHSEGFSAGKVNFTFTLIDLGLAQKYIKSGRHLEQTNLDYFRGNILFASENAVKLRTQSRKDDLESLFYLVSFIMNDLSLPWIENIQESGAIPDIFQYIIKRRIRNFSKYSEVVARGLPLQLRQAFLYIRSLKFDETPNYEFLKEQFMAIIDPISNKQIGKQQHCKIQGTPNTTILNHRETFGLLQVNNNDDISQLNNQSASNIKYQNVEVEDPSVSQILNKINISKVHKGLNNNSDDDHFDDIVIEELLKEQLFELEEADFGVSLADRSHYNLQPNNNKIFTLHFKKSTVEISDFNSSNKLNSINLLQNQFNNQSCESSSTKVDLINSNFQNNKKSSFKKSGFSNQPNASDEEILDDLSCGDDETDECSNNSPRSDQICELNDFSTMINKNDLKTKN